MRKYKILVFRNHWIGKVRLEKL
uniref:Uncharacterized protein n=1 Tax=Vitis vinifera TaxID=29760 RepID=F6H806_VITVI